MLKLIQISIAVAVVFALTGHAISGNTTPATTTSTISTVTPLAPSKTSGNDSSTGGKISSNNTGDIDYVSIIQKCNESFPISIDYLEELNNTGSFPDETDKGPMCYIKCFLETIGVLRQDFTVDKEAMAMMSLWPNSIEAIDGCLKDQAGLFDNDPNEDCGKAYYLARCVMMKELLASRPSDNT